jgi:hypothetical protein
MAVDRLQLDAADLINYEVNRRDFSLTELARYAGLHVGFSLDGTRIVASGKTIEELEQNLAAAGFDPARVVHSYIDPMPELP